MLIFLILGIAMSIPFLKPQRNQMTRSELLKVYRLHAYALANLAHWQAAANQCAHTLSRVEVALDAFY
jgi:hypothetical protein